MKTGYVMTVESIADNELVLLEMLEKQLTFFKVFKLLLYKVN